MLKYLLLFSLVPVPHVENAKILGIFGLPVKSHHILGSALLKELAVRGHDVTMLSPFPLKDPPKNYHDLNLTSMLEWKEQQANMFNINVTLIGKVKRMIGVFTTICQLVLEDEGVKSLLEDNQKFDLVIMNWVASESFLGIGHALNATTIAFSVIGTSQVISAIDMAPSPYSYVPNPFLPFTDEMSFLQRVINTLMYLLGDLVLYFVHLPYQQHLLRKYFPDAPPLHELLDDVDLVLLNANYATESPRPYMPNMIPIGGFHLQEKQNLSDELKQLLDNAKQGFIYFSMGSNIKSMHIPKETLEEILKAFSKLKYLVVWKYDAVLENKPRNVITSDWLPQRAILDHPNIVGFITHGGLGSTVESVYYGVPMVCIPLFGDQKKNVADTVQKGFGVQLQMDEITQETLTSAILEITEVPKYKNVVKLRSDIYRNQAMNPMDRAVFWVEHVLRHKGAKHLKSGVFKLSWYQYMLLDVIAFILVILMLVCGLTIFLFKKVLSMCCKKKAVTQDLKKKII